MALHEYERDLLEDTMYQHLAAFWPEFSDSISVFDAHTAAQQLCALRVWEALLDAPPQAQEHANSLPRSRDGPHDEMGR